MKKLLIPLCAATIALSPAVFAQNNQQQNTTETQNNTRFWEAKLPGGEYVVNVIKISSVSKHRYVLNGMEIVELTVDTDGNSLARFYAIGVVGQNSDANIAKNAINRGKELLNQAGQRAGTSATPVVKEYPHSTHAKTVEYRLADEAEIDALFRSVKRAWMRGRGGTVTIK